MASKLWYWCLCCGKPFDLKKLMTCKKHVTYHCAECHKSPHKPQMKVRAREKETVKK